MTANHMPPVYSQFFKKRVSNDNSTKEKGYREFSFLRQELQMQGIQSIQPGFNWNVWAVKEQIAAPAAVPLMSNEYHVFESDTCQKVQEVQELNLIENT